MPISSSLVTVPALRVSRSLVRVATRSSRTQEFCRRQPIGTEDFNRSEPVVLPGVQNGLCVVSQLVRQVYVIAVWTNVFLVKGLDHDPPGRNL